MVGPGVGQLGCPRGQVRVLVGQLLAGRHEVRRQRVGRRGDLPQLRLVRPVLLLELGQRRRRGRRRDGFFGGGGGFSGGGGGNTIGHGCFDLVCYLFLFDCRK